jgi:C4-dicarboxylate transporter, DctM subunit
MEAAGINAIQFGIIVTVHVHPALRLNLFSSQAIFDALLSRIYRGVPPFLLLNFMALLIISYVPQSRRSCCGIEARRARSQRE